MPLVIVNAHGTVPLLDGCGAPGPALTAALAKLPPAAPVVLLIHGYKFSPAHDRTSPHRHILSLEPRADCRKAVSWPRHLGFGKGDTHEGLCIAFGWEARGTIWQAWRQSAAAARALAALIRLIRDLRPAPADIVAHSLGARVALAAVPELPAGSTGRLVLMAAAEFRSAAHRALASPAGRSAEFINVTTRENAAFDLALEWTVRAPQRRDRALGAGLGGRHPNWLDLRIDCPDCRAALAGIGFRIPAPTGRICHWSPYLRPGLFGLYTALIRQRDSLPLARLAQALPASPGPRGPRLRGLARPRIIAPRKISFGGGRQPA